MTEISPWAQIVGPCYTAAALARALNWTEAEVATAVKTLDVLELDTAEGVLLYPAFQVRAGRLVEGLGEVLRTLSTGTKGRWTWAQWMNARPDDGEGGMLPSAIEQLRAGQLDDVLIKASHDAWSWSS